MPTGHFHRDPSWEGAHHRGAVEEEMRIHQRGGRAVDGRGRRWAGEAAWSRIWRLGCCCTMQTGTWARQTRAQGTTAGRAPTAARRGRVQPPVHGGDANTSPAGTGDT